MRKLAIDPGKPKTTVMKNITQNLGVTRMYAKFGLRFLITEHKSFNSKSLKMNLKIVTNKENVLEKIISGDE